MTEKIECLIPKHLIHATGAHPRDVRMTTRFKSHDLSEGLTGAIHETGHALYEQARNMKYDGLPVNEVRLEALAAAQNSRHCYRRRFKPDTMVMPA